MSKAVLISIRPKWCELIASGHKTIEIRKTRPQIKTPFKCYIYCTNNGDTLYSVNAKVQPCNSFEINLKEKSRVLELNGNVIGEFVCDEIMTDSHGEHDVYFEHHACVTVEEQREYAPDGTIYGWHISALKIYNNPLALSDFIRPCCERVSDCGNCRKFDRANFSCTRMNTVTRPPQSWMYVEERKTGGNLM